jgi:voltage-gated potassium channel
MKGMYEHFKLFFKEIFFLIKTPFFIMLTIVGNGFILFSGLIFWGLEHDVNPKVERYIDAIWWSFATATTTGYGDITPVTDAGKILGIFLMLMGLALFAVFTALFAETIISNKELFNRDGRKEE